LKEVFTDGRDNMSDIKLFKIHNGVEELPATWVSLERELQTLIEQNMPTFFGVTFLKTEYVTSNDGRIDSLGVDENNCPVIFEYKRSSNENVINQGLFYLDWLLDHKADFELLVMKTLGKEASDKLDWSMPRLICVAGDFTKYDEYAVKQINRNIDLVRYKKFGNEMLMLELINSNVAKPLKEIINTSPTKQGADKTFSEQLQLTSPNLRGLYSSIRDYIMALGDDIAENPLKLYVAFKKIKNIVCAEVYQKQILLHLRLNPDTIELEEGFTRDMRGVGHFGTGDLQISIKSVEDFEKAKALIDKAYELN
jgi:predicted transport protein